mmetsp:Transcript_31922/g.54991  ORF Transcript_31922/g.54991 Transcript_31922/m.54991 type:complete len:509 (+) Transcript_31922:1417-2943(+)
MEKIFRLREILEKPIKTENELNVLRDTTKDIDFFRKLKEDHGTDELHTSCCKVMKTSAFEAGEYIFHFGDRGENFCIILEGRIEIFVPPKNTKPDNAAEQPSQNDQNEQPTHRDSMISTLSRASMISRRSSDLSSIFLRRLQRSRIFKPSEIPFNPQNETNFIKVAELGVGGSFGELALLKGGNVRNASVKCIEATTLLTLSRSDFNKILGNLEEKRLNEKVSFLSHVQCLKNLSKGALYKLSYYFTMKHFKRGDEVYKEGEESSKVYVVVTGEFQFSKKSQQKQRSMSVQRLPLNRVDRLYTDMRERISQSKPAELNVMIKGPKEMFGDEDIIDRSTRKYSCFCLKNATVYYIDKHDLLRRLPHADSWELLKEKHAKESRWLDSRLESLETVEDLKVSSFLMKDEPPPSTPQRVKIMSRCVTERTTDPIFQTEVTELSPRVADSPLKRTSSKDISPQKSIPMPKLEIQNLPIRSCLFSRSARRQTANLYMPKIELRKMSYVRSVSRL